MSNPYFHFKQFTVWHDRCAMKVGTDGVLLGAWCNVPRCGRILDVGCGSGLISLMMAQRTSPDVSIDGVEIDIAAAEQAAENVARSPWPDRIHIHTADFLDYISATAERYNCIVSNPPYFERELSFENTARVMARHTGKLSYESLFGGASTLLVPGGLLSLIFPAVLQEQLTLMAARFGLFPRRILKVSGRQAALPKRVLMEWGSEPVECQEEYIAIETVSSQWTPEYKALMAPFYLYI